MSGLIFEVLTKVVLPAVVACVAAAATNHFASKRSARDFKIKQLNADLDRVRNYSWEVHDIVIDHLTSVDGPDREQSKIRCLRKISRVVSCIEACKPNISSALRVQLTAEAVAWKRALTNDPFPLGNRQQLDISDGRIRSIEVAQMGFDEALVRIVSESAEGQ